MSFGKSATDREERINFERMREFRLHRAVEAMKQEGLGALITWDAYDIRYISGVYVTVPTRWPESQACILVRDGDYRVNVGFLRQWYVGEAEMPWLKGKIIPGRLGPTKQARTVADCENMVKTVGKIMADHGVTNEPLGMSGCSSELLFAEAFRQAGIKAVDGKNAMFEARKIKSRDEIECVRTACSNADAAFADMKDAVRPGITECGLLGVGMKKLYELGSDEAMEFVVASGYRTNPFHIDYTDKVIDPGDLIIIDINGNSWQGYKSCYYRTFCCGKPTEEQKESYEICRKILYDAMDAVKAGVTTWDVASKWPDSPKFWGEDSWDIVIWHAAGHGIGIALHELPSINRTSEANPIKLEEGMVVALETWYGKKGSKQGGVRLEENIVVTKDGYELLTHWPIDELTECWM